jgi:predicted ATPase
MTWANLNLTTIQALLRDVLSTRTDERISDLAELILERTGGNPFHTIQLLEHLESCGLMEYSRINFRWTWDIDRIRDETMDTHNVAVILKGKIHLLSPQAIKVLKHCACLGYRFHESVLPVVIAAATNSGRFEGSTVGDQDDMSERDLSIYMRDIFLIEQLLEQVGEETHLKFTHDMVHQAVMDLVVETFERSQLHFQLGMELYKRFFLQTLL